MQQISRVTLSLIVSVVFWCIGLNIFLLVNVGYKRGLKHEVVMFFLYSMYIYIRYCYTPFTSLLDIFSALNTSLRLGVM